jgi:hypothetical protein
MWSALFCRFALTLKRLFFTRDKKKKRRRKFLIDTSEEIEEETRGAKEQLIKRKVSDLSCISL